MTSTTIATVSYVDCVDITEMSEQELSELLGIPSRQEAGDNVMLQVLNLLEHGRSQTLTVENLQVIKSYVDEMLGC
jgi:hypothetical protein